MEITREADYASRIVLDLAMTEAKERVHSEDIARRCGIPLPVVARIVARLATTGLLDTRRGIKGGVLLARDPAEITVLEIIEAIDGRIVLNRCQIRPAECVRSRVCPMHRVWSETRNMLREHLASVTIQSLADQNPNWNLISFETHPQRT